MKCAATSAEPYYAFIPPALPPVPPLRMEEIYPLLDRATAALGRLDGISLLLPDPTLFLYMYVRKEAVLSSQIEGTQSSLSDLLLFETESAPGVPMDDVTEVSNYVAAMDYGLERLKTFPLSLRLIREIHEKLMSGARGGHKMPGAFRTSQNWVGGTRPGNARFVPPPPEKLMELLGDLESFLHDRRHSLPALVKAALAHVQFETIHPFLDGNGRLGRLLITFILCVENVIKEPLLYLSLYLKTHRQTYYDLLQAVREKGAWEEWVRFFLTGVIETAEQATQTTQKILKLFEEDHKKIGTHGKSVGTVLKLHAYFQRRPIATTTKIAKECDMNLQTVLRGLAVLEQIGIVKETTGKERHKIYAYRSYIQLLNEAAAPDEGRGLN